MTDTPSVQFEYLPPIKVYIPGPLASRAGNALREMQQVIAETLQAMRHSVESDHDPVPLEVMAERLHAVTRKARRAGRAHVAAWQAEVQAREMGMPISTDTEGADDETSPELEP